MKRIVRRPTLDELERLLLFADKQGAKAVADERQVGASAISHSFEKLRKLYGFLEKQGAGHTLTARGKEALPAIRALLRQHDHLVQWLAGCQAKPQVVSVAVGTLTSQLTMPRTLRRFAQTQPDWQVQVQVKRGRDRIVGTANGDIDVAVVSHDPGQIQTVLLTHFRKEMRLECEDLGRKWLCLIARQGTPFGKQLSRGIESHEISIDRLGEFELIGLDEQSGIRRQLERYGGSANRPVRFRLEAGGWVPAKEWAREGLGVAIVPLSLLSLDDRQKVFEIRLLASNGDVKDSLIYSRGAVNPGKEALIQALKRTVKDQQAELRRDWGKCFPL